MNIYQEGLIHFIVHMIEINDQRINTTNDAILKKFTVETEPEIEVLDFLLNVNYN